MEQRRRATRGHCGHVWRRRDGGSERARADIAEEQPNHGSDDTNVTHFMLDLGEALAGGDAAKVTRARNLDPLCAKLGATYGLAYRAFPAATSRSRPMPVMVSSSSGRRVICRR